MNMCQENVSRRIKNSHNRTRKKLKTIVIDKIIYTVIL